MIKTLRLCLILAALAAGFPALAAEPAHPSIRHAIETLERSKAELQNGEHGFGGHRSAAIEHIDLALKELHQALAYADAHPDEIKAPAQAK